MTAMTCVDRKSQASTALLRPLLRLKSARRRKLRRIKRLIDQGGYDSERKLSLAMDRLLDDLLG